MCLVAALRCFVGFLFDPGVEKQDSLQIDSPCQLSGEACGDFAGPV